MKNFLDFLQPEKFKKAAKQAEKVLAVQILKDTDPFVPAQTGVFSKLAYTYDNNIVYQGDQARYLYEGKVMVDEQNRHAVYIKDVGWRHRKGAKLHAIDKDLVFTTDMHPEAQAHWMEASEDKNAEKWARVAEKAIDKYLK